MNSNKEEKIRFLVDLLNKSADKYIYTLLSFAAAGIGFSIHQTSDKALSLSQIPLAFAVFLWTLSFYYGNSAIKGQYTFNSVLLDMQSIGHPATSFLNIPFKSSEEGFSKLREIADSLIENRKKQLGFFMKGASLFILWHIFEMLCLLLKS